MAEAHHQFTWRHGKRLKEIVAAWTRLKKPHRTKEVLLFGTDAAKLERAFVAEKVNPILAAAGADVIDDEDGALPVDAGDE